MLRVAKISILATFLGLPAMAQTPEAPAGGGTADAPATAPTEATVTAPQAASIAPQEMLAQSQDYRARINETQARLNGLIDAARKDKDIIRLNCLTDKSVQVKANATIADQAIAALQDAMSRNDDGASLHEFTRVTIVNQKVQVLSQEADACVGEDLTFVGQTRVDVEEPKNLPTNPTDLPPPTLVPERPPVERPAAATTYM